MFYRRVQRIVSMVVLLSLLLPTFTSAAQAEATAVTDDEIIYLDAAGFIRIIDPNVATGTQAIDWVSPEGGWHDIAVGDFNNDGDMEIVAIGNSKLVIYDPVVRSAAVTPDDVINNVPWARLFEMPIPGTPNLVGAGNLDQNVAGHEIIFGYSTNEGNNINYRMTVIKKTDTEGRAWTTHITGGYAASWKFLAVGNINNVGSDDIVRIRDIDHRVEAIEVDNNFNRIFERAGDSLFTYTTAAIGRFHPSPTGEVAIARTFQGTSEARSLLLYSFTNNAWGVQTEDQWNFFPHPKHVFFADINGNGLDELFWLRDLPANAPLTFQRLHRVPRAGDGLPPFQARLDEDNGYTRGAGGDTNGDGRDEIVVMRNNKILMFNSAHTGDATSNTREWTNISTNGRSLILANVDGEGYKAGARLAASRESVAVSLEAGTLSTATLSVEITNAGSGGNIPLTVTKENNASWFTFSVSSATTPANIYLTGFSAAQLAPGIYRERLRITSSADVINQPFFVTVEMTVNEAKFNLSASSVGFIFRTDETAAKVQNVAVDGLPGLRFSAALLAKPDYQAAVAALGETPNFGYVSEEGDVVLSNSLGEEYRIEVEGAAEVSAAANTWPSVEWATVESNSNIVPATITITVDPADVVNMVQQAVLVVLADERAGSFPDNIRTAEVSVLKGVTSVISLPFISR
jgi:hypothetical protein